MVIKIPSPLKGYVNLGDCIVLLSAWVLPWGYAFLSAGIGSALADVVLGYVIYAPATFFIKGITALIAYFVFALLSKKIGRFWSQFLGGVLGEIFMVLSYFIFEGFLYGFIPSMVNILPNCVQGVAGIVIGICLIKIIEKTQVIANK